MIRTRQIAALAAIGASATGFAAAPDASPVVVPACCSAHPEVYHAFGEREGIRSVMQIFMRRVMASPELRPFFEDSDRGKLIEGLTDYFCQVMGGECVYTGRSMFEAHEGQHIRYEHFNALVMELQAAMRERGVPVSAQNRVLAALAPQYRQIVEHP